MKKIIILLAIILIVSGCEFKNNNTDETPKPPEIVKPSEPEVSIDINETRIKTLKSEMERLYNDKEATTENVSYVTSLESLTLEDENFEKCDKKNTYFSLSFFSEGPMTKQYRITLDCSDNEKIITYFYNNVEIDRIYTDYIDRIEKESDQ